MPQRDRRLGRDHVLTVGTREPVAGRDPGHSGTERPDQPPGQRAVTGCLCLPAGSLDAGQFAQCGPAADMPPDPLLAAIIDAATPGAPPPAAAGPRAGATLARIVSGR